MNDYLEFKNSNKYINKNDNMEGISQTYENELFDYILRYKELKNHYPNNKKAILMLLTFSNRNWEKYTNKLIIK